MFTEKWKLEAEAPNFAQILNFDFAFITSKGTHKSVGELGGAILGTGSPQLTEVQVTQFRTRAILKKKEKKWMHKIVVKCAEIFFAGIWRKNTAVR